MSDPINFEEIRLNIRDESLSLCKKNDHSRVEKIHLLYAIGRFLGSEEALKFVSLDAIQEKLNSIPRSPSIAIVITGEFESAYEKIQNLKTTVEVAKEIWESLSLGGLNQDKVSSSQELESFTASESTDIEPLVPENEVTVNNLFPASLVERSAPQESRRDSLVRELSELVERKQERNSELVRIELEKQKIIGEFEDYLKAEEDLRDWRAERERSFAWKLMTRMREIESALKKDEEKTLDFVMKKVELDDEFSKKTRNWVLKNLLINSGFFGTVCLVLWLVRRFENSIIDFFSQTFNNSVIAFIAKFIIDLVLSINYGQVFLYTVLISLFAFIGMLFGYSRRVDAYSYELAQQLEETRVMEEAIGHVRRGREKVGALHPQIDSLLRIYSLPLHAPWAIDPRYENFSGILPNTSGIPESLEFAVPTETSINEKFEGLVLSTLNKIQQSNWRNDSMNELFANLMNSIGMPNNNDAIEQLEADQRMGGKRRVLLEQNEDLRKRILLQIGDKKVREYSRIVQEQILPNLQPDVKSLRPDPLEDLELTDSLGAKQDAQVSSWEEKLRETAGTGTALSALNYSNTGKANSKHLEPIESLFICSKQVQVERGIERHQEVEAGTRPFEVSIRVDLGSWCKPGDLAIFDGLVVSEISESKSPESEQAEVTNIVF